MRSVTFLAAPLLASLALACDKGAASTAPAVTAAPDVQAQAPVAQAPSQAPSPAPAGSAPSTPQAAGIPADVNVVVISIDSLRADMPWQNPPYARPIAPRLTELAKKSAVYTNFYASSSYTSMSLGGFLGGRPPSELLRSGYFFSSYPDKNLFFPELLQKANITTVATQAHWYFGSAGWEQGFTNWELIPNLKKDNSTDTEVTAPRHEALAETQLTDASKKGRFFAWYHFMDPHDVYFDHKKDGVEPYGKGQRDKYDGEVTFTDTYVGKLVDFIDAQPWGSKTIVLITADHGEAFGEHGATRHGFEVWEPLVRIPLVVHGPGIPARRIDIRRSALDLAPTFLDLFGAPKEASFRGESLRAEWAGTTGPVRYFVVDLPETSNNDKRRAFYRGKYKMLRQGAYSYRLYDLETDPGEDKPLPKDATFNELKEAFEAYDKTLTEAEPTQCKKGCLFTTAPK
jgi:arylsulfatase A-like enzyme